MKMKLLFISLFLGIVGLLSAKEVPKNVAEKAARNFYYQHVNQIRNHAYTNIDLSLAMTENKSSHKAYYAFNVNDNDGFVLISADDMAKPVLAYAFKGEFNPDNMHPGQAEMLNWYAEQIAYIADSEKQGNPGNKENWQALINYKPEKGVKSLKSVESLMLTEWDQGYPYNQACPEDPDGISGHVPVGCVATAMGQIMKHWDYPETGTGSKTHSSWSNGGYGNITINFANQTYDWSGIPLTGNGLNDELAKVNFHIGVAVAMYWSPSGSGTSTDKVASALPNYFRYDESCQIISKSSYSDSDYKDVLKNQLDNDLPMVYSGSPESGAGHAWNCDGYMDDEFHMNWGWGGAGNGYYTLDNLVSSATPGGDDYNFIYNQQAVIDIYPDENYPEYCNGTKSVYSHQGAFGDGSADENYQNNVDCEYIISPECGQLVNLNFERFDLADGDVIHIYDGDSDQSPLLESFDMDNQPSSTVRSVNGSMLVQFLTNGTETAKGWYVNYTTDYCKSGLEHTAQSGTVTDGSGTCDYEESTVCSWYIQPEGAESIDLEFTEFDLGGTQDYLSVYANNSSELIEQFNAGNQPDELVVDAPVVFLQFYADADDDVGSGFSVDYEIASGINDSEILKGTTVFPNPASNQVNLGFSLNQSTRVKIKMYDLLGKKVGTATVDGIKGYQTLKIDKLIDLPESGVFLIDVVAGNQKTTKRISIIR
ncbi:MAG: C10 family peptidase [Bacteroidota bacterium]